MKLSDVAKKIMEVDDDKYVSIGYGRYKLKGKEDDDNAEVFTKTDSGQYVKSADQKSDDDKGGEEEPKGKGLGKGDFERDFDDGDPEDAWDDEEGRAKPTGKTDADAWEDDPVGEPEDAEKRMAQIDKERESLSRQYNRLDQPGADKSGEGKAKVMKKWDALDAEYDELEKSVGDEPEGGKDESITINGQKYKPIKESVNEAVLTISYQPIFDADKKDKLEKIAKKSGLTIRSRGAQGFTVDGKRANVEKFIKATRGLIEIKESIKESKTSNPRKFKEIYERTFRSLK